jgi:hypothetical protein
LATPHQVPPPLAPSTFIMAQYKTI